MKITSHSDARRETLAHPLVVAALNCKPREYSTLARELHRGGENIRTSLAQNKRPATFVTPPGGVSLFIRHIKP